MAGKWNIAGCVNRGAGWPPKDWNKRLELEDGDEVQAALQHRDEVLDIAAEALDLLDDLHTGSTKSGQDWVVVERIAAALLDRCRAPSEAPEEPLDLSPCHFTPDATERLTEVLEGFRTFLRDLDERVKELEK